MIKGKVWKYGDNVNTDVIFPGKYTYTVTERSEMARYALEDLDPRFAKEVKAGDIIVAGKNFGCGSSREQAAICLKLSGVGAIIAPSFSRIFFRNAVNEGLPLITTKEAPQHIADKEEIEVDFEKGEIHGAGKTFGFPPLPANVMEIMNDGGLIPHLKKKLKDQA
ncbi:MAG: 3-isopropylmalate dehydratase small subunit [Candidatus Eremiobacteraeota bacterium]|nr:3-isopropylmalate dehydratase small subunit [Candidatus Eremiobacteraeota bacterium]